MAAEATVVQPAKLQAASVIAASVKTAAINGGGGDLYG